MAAQRDTMLSRVKRFIEYKRKLGYVWHVESFMLRSFGKYVDRRAPRQPITVSLALAWATAPKGVSRLYCAKRLDVVRTFAKHEAATDFETEIPPQRILGPSYSRVEPYIYTKSEIITLIETAKNFAHGNQFAYMTYPTVIGLLACTGMRVGELLALDDEDVDLVHSLIRIHRSKDLPLRVIPIRRSATRQLAAYKVQRNNWFSCEKNGQFILGADGTKLKYCTLLRYFHFILDESGINRRSNLNRTPRLHDLRHTFACNHLVRAYRENRDIDSAVHDLAVYLGHAILKSTYWYLTGIPELFKECTKRFEKKVQGGV